MQELKSSYYNTLKGKKIWKSERKLFLNM
jgi:hypothetical protein